MNKIALKKFVIIRYLSSCHKYPYGYEIFMYHSIIVDNK